MKRIVAALPLSAPSLVLAQSTPAGWKEIRDDRGRFRMAVPCDWKQHEIMGQKLAAANAPDKAVDAVVNQMKGPDWSSFKSIVYQIYAKEKAAPKIEDGPERLWFEIVTMKQAGKTGWYVAVPAGGDTCNAQVNFKTGDRKAEGLARKIVDSIRGS